MGVHYTMFDVRNKELVELDKEAYIYAENIPDVLYFIQNNMKYNSDECEVVDDMGNSYEDYELDTFTEINANKREDANFVFIKSEETEDGLEIITLVRNNKRQQYREANWRDTARRLVNEK